MHCWVRDKDHIEKAFDFGGMPARNGVAAATMVEIGMTGVEDALSGDRNFFSAFSQSARPEMLIERLGEKFEILATRKECGAPNGPRHSLHFNRITGKWDQIRPTEFLWSLA